LYDGKTMTRKKKGLCTLLAGLLVGVSAFGNDLPQEKVAKVRTGMTICGAVLGLGIGIAGSLDLIPAGTPLADTLLVLIPTTAAMVATGTLAARWIADRTLAIQPKLLFSPIVGAGLGMLGAAFSGGISFALGMAIAIPATGVSTGSLNYPQSIGMAVLAGALWGGIAGIPTGAVAVPIISLYMRF
jgi:hypothetical protein